MHDPEANGPRGCPAQPSFDSEALAPYATDFGLTHCGEWTFGVCILRTLW